MVNVQIVLFDGFDWMDVIGPYEVFTAAKMLSGAQLDVSLVSAEGARTVPSGMNGPGLAAVGSIDLKRGGTLVIPGAMGTVGLDDAGPDAVVTRLKQALETRLIDVLRQAMQRQNVTVVAVCGGAMLLAMDGLLEGRYAVTHYLGMEALGAAGAKPVPARVVVDGRLVTGGGVTSGLDVALYLVERELGPRISHAVEKLFEYERRGTVWHETGVAPLASERQEAPGPAPEQAAPPPAGIEGVSPHDFAGQWNLTISTPIGKLPVAMTVSVTDGIIRGMCREGGEVSELIDPRIQDGRMTWSLNVKKPMRLYLKFSAAVHGDTLAGTAKAGMLPASKVEGTRSRQ